MPNRLVLLVVTGCLLLLAVAQAQPPRAPTVLSRLSWFTRAGAELGAIGPLADHGNLELSPDGTKVAVAVLDRATGTRDIWMYDARLGDRTRFTTEPADENWLIWSPDGARVILNSFAPDLLTLFEAPATAGGRRSLLLDGAARWPVSWSPDGRYVAFVTSTPATSNDIWVLPLFGNREPMPYSTTEASENWAAFSPDGQYLAYSSTESGNVEVYVAPFPPTGKAWRVSADGGSQARWRRDGAEIFYLSPDRTVMAATVARTGTELTMTKVEPLFRTTYPYGAYHAFDVSADGQRFLVNTMPLDSRAAPVIALAR